MIYSHDSHFLQGCYFLLHKAKWLFGQILNVYNSPVKMIHQYCTAHPLLSKKKKQSGDIG